MSAPKGNRNGAATWYKPIADEPTVQIGTRVPRTLLGEIEEQLSPGENRADFLRRAIAAELERRKNLCPPSEKVC